MVIIYNTSSVYTDMIYLDYVCIPLKYMSRKKVSRKTKETSISVEVNIDGKGKYQIDMV
jgi:hypothetical protein